MPRGEGAENDGTDWLALVLAGSAAAQVTSIVSTRTNGSPSNKDGFSPKISADGRYVGFFCYDNLIVLAQQESLFVHSDTYLRDRLTGALERISVNSNEVQGDSFSYSPVFNPDVRYVAFASYATNLVPGDTNGPYPDGFDVFVRDRVSGTTERVSVGALGQGNASSHLGSISADGRYVAFSSDASNLVPGDTNGVSDIFVRDRVGGVTERLSVDSGGAQGDGACLFPSISADGRYVAFVSAATNLVAGDTNASQDVFLRDRLGGTTERVSVDSAGAQGDAASDAAALSPDARYVVFRSTASNLVPGDTNGLIDVFLHDRQSGTTERVSLGQGGVEADGDTTGFSLTPDARFVAFQSRATNLVPGDTNGRGDVFVRDRQTGRTERVSVDTSGAQGSADSGIQWPSISASGAHVAFDSRASLVETDTNSWHDIYVRDRRYSPLASLCSPGLDGVVPCPCSNPPSGPGRGCDNAAGTGGAVLSGSGVAYLSMDSFVLTTSGEGPTAISIVLQADALVGTGAVFGHGVRCAGGMVTRLYVKTASGGGIVAPDVGAGDPAISARAAAAGDPIQPGDTRWYFVYYRQPTVLGGCPASSAFNATQTGEVVWMP